MTDAVVFANFDGKVRIKLGRKHLTRESIRRFLRNLKRFRTHHNFVDEWSKTAMNLKRGTLWLFKSQSANPATSPYWTFEEDRPSTPVRASCSVAIYKNWPITVCASCC